MVSPLTDYRDRLDRDPLTRNQLGAIHREFYRLGFHVTADRAERLRLTAALAQLPGIDSTKELTMGEAGRVVGALTGCRTTRDLYALAAPDPEPEPARPWPILAALISWLSK